MVLFGSLRDGWLRWVYGAAIAALAVAVAVVWDAGDWEPIEVLVLVALTVVGLDSLSRHFDDCWGMRFTAGSVAPLVLAAVLLGPAPAAIVGAAGSVLDSVLLRARPRDAVANAFNFALYPLAAGVLAQGWVTDMHGPGFLAAVFVLVVAADAINVVVTAAILHGLGSVPAATTIRDYRPVLPWVVVMAIVVVGASHGYREGGFGVLALMAAGLVLCQWLLLKIESVEQSLRAERDLHASYLRMVGTIVVSLDAGGRVTFMNERARQVLGGAVGQPWLEVAGAVAGADPFEITIRSAEGSERVTQWSPTPLRNPQGAAGGVLLSGEDVTARRDAERRVEFLAYNDALTGLPNRAAFDEELPVALAMVHDCGVAAALFLLDIDNFKRVNDDHGHDAGDVLLTEVAARLRAVAAPDELLVRRGGDQFLLLAPDLGVPADDPGGARRAAAAVAERVVRAFEAPFPVGAVGVTVPVSIATALYPFDTGSSPMQLERVAESALYGLKQRSISSVY